MKIANIIYILFILVSFGYLFMIEFVFRKFDNAVHYKMLKKYYVPNQGIHTRTYKRKGVIAVLFLWLVYLLFLGAIKRLGFLSWQVFLIGACIMFMLNSIFIRKICLLSVFFLHNKSHCCKNCGINSWDYAIFASSLVFAPKLSIVATILNWIIIVISFAILIVWEYNYHKHPYRFYPETNATLGCKNCLKQCKYMQK